MSLKVTTDKLRPDAYVIIPVGSIDSETYGNLQEPVRRILDLSPKVIVIDMQGVEFISSMGVRVIVNTRKELEAKGGYLLLTNFQPQIKKIFEIMKIMPLANIFNTMEDVENFLYSL